MENKFTVPRPGFGRSASALVARARLVATRSMRHLPFVFFVSFVVIFLPGCANSALDRDFRAKFSDVTFSLQGGYQQGDRSYSGGGSVDLKLRDPSKDGLSK